MPSFATDFLVLILVIVSLKGTLSVGIGAGDVHVEY